MKNILPVIILAITILAPLSCQKPDEFEAVRSSSALVTFSAKFMYDESDDNNFKGEIDYENHIINVVFPYNYPVLSDNVLTKDVLKKMRVQATTENNVIIEPPLLFMDLSKDNVITIVDKLEGTRTDYLVRAEIRKSAECSVTSFNFGDLGLSGVISEETNTISIVAVEEIGVQKADVTISHGASISPDPRVTPLNWEVGQTLTVTAQNGTDRTVYTVVKSVPEKVAAGIRPGSGVLKWTRKLSTIEGITDAKNVHGMAITPEGIVINQQGSTSMPVIKATDGSTLDSKFTLPSGTNYFMTSDDSGNILFCNYRSAASGKFVLYKAGSLTETPQVLINYTDPNAYSKLGWKFSVTGSVDGDALISTCCLIDNGTKPSVAVWTIRGGALESSTPTYISLTFDPSIWGKWSDAVFSGTSIDSDLFVCSYARYPDPKGARYILWFDGATATEKTSLKLWNNSVLQTAAFASFNGSPYLAYSNCNTFNWGVSNSDWIKMHDVSTGNLDSPLEVIPPKKYGGQPAGLPNANGFSDVLMVPSENGFFLNVYFYFAGGYIGMVQYDCIKQ